MATSDALLEQALLLIAEHHGIAARDGRTPAWLRARLAAGLRALGSARGEGPDELLASLTTDAALRAELGEVLRVGETRFFRDAPQWEALRRRLSSSGAGRLRALSAGCSTGEEAYTLGMLLDEAAAGRPLRVVGMDKSPVALAAARAGTYAAEAARELPLALSQRYLSPAPDAAVRVNDALLARVSFRQGDLLQGLPPGDFDVVVCKNVLIYLGDEAGGRLLSTLEASLSDDGLLLLARSEVPRARAFGLHAVELEPGVVGFGRRGR
jgi:chemotaxis protein methyltransferase CheR